MFPCSCIYTETALKITRPACAEAAGAVYFLIILKRITTMNSDIILISILLVGLVLLNKEYIRSEFLTKKEDE